MNLTTPETRDFARRLLANEAGAGKTTDVKAAVVIRVCEKLRHSLSALAGVDGFRSLLSRALALAKAEFPGLRAAHVNRDGSLEGLEDPAGVASVDAARPAVGGNTATDGGVILIAHLLGLLFLFIGMGLTLRLLEDSWPGAGFDGVGSGKET